MVSRRFTINAVFLFLCIFQTLGLVYAAVDPVARLQDSYSAGSAERRDIYSDVISVADRLYSGSSTADRRAQLAAAVALRQKAMDAEDEFIAGMQSAAPGFRKLNGNNPAFTTLNREAAERFGGLYADFPFAEPYGLSALVVARHWGDGQALLSSALSFKQRFPLSRFWKRLYLLAGCRLLIEKRYGLASRAFRQLWSEVPSGSQAVKAYGLVEAMGRGRGGNGSDPLELTAAERLAWGRAQGLSGYPVLKKLIGLHPATVEAEEAYCQVFRNIRWGFAGRSLSRNYSNAKIFDKYYKDFVAAFPRSDYLQESLELRADFHYHCGKKSQAIARKNDYRWRTSKRSRYRSVSRKYASNAERHFKVVAALDREAASRFPGTRCSFRAGVLGARSMIERDLFDKAVVRLSGLLSRGPDSLSLNMILCHLGLVHYLKTDYRTAVDYLAQLGRVELKDADYWSRGMLFLGKSHLEMGDSLSAGRVFGALSRAFPYTYYGIRARSLENDLPGKYILRRWPGSEYESPPWWPDNYTRTGAMFQEHAAGWQALGFFSEAAYVYSNALSQCPDDLLLRYRHHENYLRAGWYQRVLRGFRRPFSRFLQKGGNGLPDNFWQLAYLNPEPYRETIARQSGRFNIPRSLITAVIRQESNFNPQARSHAKALGLMQLLPSVARRLSRGLGLGRITSRRLYDPEVNIPLGVKFLSMNLNKYEGNIALAISCYNADPRNIPVWLERLDRMRGTTGGFDLDLFIELIPLDETRDYNIRVLHNLWRYQEVYSEKRSLFCWKLDSF
ncbi:MAG: lytic transglycosylase domain-containing protein [Gemmatimonadota bacterium]|nr:lytic transglycosylase domain-containing protein [Gemmatimonadota bacterium]